MCAGAQRRAHALPEPRGGRWRPVEGIPSRDRGINGGDPHSGEESVYAAKALERRSAPQGMLQGRGWGNALPAPSPYRQRHYGQCIPGLKIQMVYRHAGRNGKGVGGGAALLESAAIFQQGEGGKPIYWCPPLSPLREAGNSSLLLWPLGRAGGRVSARRTARPRRHQRLYVPVTRKVSVKNEKR